VNIEAAATRVECSCYDDAGAEPSVSFMHAGRVSIRTADGAWNETFDARFGPSELRSGATAYMVRSARGEIVLSALRGRCTLPANLERPPCALVQLSLNFQDEGWILHRTVEVDRTKPSAVCMCPGDLAPAWSRPQLRFARAASTP
jgi:hypothetical protein